MARKPSPALMADRVFQLWWFFYSRWADWRCRHSGHTTRKGLPPFPGVTDYWLCGRCGEQFYPGNRPVTTVQGRLSLCGKLVERLWVLRSRPAVITVRQSPARLRSAGIRHWLDWSCGSWLPSLVSPTAGARLLSVAVARFTSWGLMSAPRTGAPPYFPFYPNDYLGSQRVQIMSMAERGLYQTLLAFDWNGNGLPIELESLAKLTGLDRRTFRQLWPKVEVCFPVKNGRRFNPRLEIERAKADERSHSARNAAAVRWQYLPEPSPSPEPVVPELQKQLLTDSHKALVGTLNGAGMTLGSGTAHPDLPAVSEQTAPVGAERELTDGNAAFFCARADSPYNRYFEHAKCGNPNDLDRVLDGDPHRSGPVVHTAEGEGAENSGEPTSRQASRNATATSCDGTDGHSVHDGTANPVAGTDSRQKLPVPGTSSLQTLAGLQEPGDAQVRTAETPPVGSAAGAAVSKGGRRAEARDALRDECWAWLRPYRDVWESVHAAGSFSHKLAAPYLGPLHKAHGSELVAANLRRYLEVEDVRFQNFSRFAQHFAAYGPPSAGNASRESGESRALRSAAEQAYSALQSAVAVRGSVDLDEPGRLAGWKAIGGAEGFRLGTDRIRERFIAAYLAASARPLAVAS